MICRLTRNLQRDEQVGINNVGFAVITTEQEQEMCGQRTSQAPSTTKPPKEHRGLSRNADGRKHGVSYLNRGAIQARDVSATVPLAPQT